MDRMLLDTTNKKAICFENSYVLLGKEFYASVKPTPVEMPCIVKLNYSLALDLGFDFSEFEQGELAEIFSGNQILPGAEPLAMVYAGHQFGNLVPQLGDGRAILLGEVIDNSNLLFSKKIVFILSSIVLVSDSKFSIFLKNHNFKFSFKIQPISL